MNCACQVCARACRYKPGWFLPGEAELAAESAGLAFDEFFSTRLAVDYWEAGPDIIYVLAPATTTMDAGGMYPEDPRGRCIFLDDAGRCSIHGAHPFECREYNHTDATDDVRARHRYIRDEWTEHQEQPTRLLGY